MSYNKSNTFILNASILELTNLCDITLDASFITSTTVGFGDYYLEHESITGSDVFGFASLILVAFVLLSSFLNKLADLVKSSSKTPEDEEKGPTFEEILRDTPIFSSK